MRNITRLISHNTTVKGKNGDRKKTPISDYGYPVLENVCISSRPLPALAFKTMNLFWLNRELKVSIWALQVILKKFEN